MPVYAPADLPWLAEPGGVDIDALCARIADDPKNTKDLIAAAARSRLGARAERRLRKAVGALTDEGLDATGLAVARLGILGSGTFDPLAEALETACLRHDVWAKSRTAGYGQGLAEALDPHSAFNAGPLDAVLVAYDARDLGFQAATDDDPVGPALETVEAVCAAVSERHGATPIVATLPVPPRAVLGSLDARIEGTARNRCERFNAGVRGLAGQGGCVLFDAEAVAATVGTATWFDPAFWNVAKLAVAPGCLALYADHVARLVGALMGRSRKVLVLDLDNTIWGGVVGDDGVEGIVLGQGDAVGEAYLDVQRTALDLRRAGIALAVCSKNDEAIALDAIDTHPDMLIRRDHLATYRIDWTDKASNLEAIAATLNLGLDSFVLVDDNPAERAHVRDALPAVAVPELPEDPSLYADALLQAGYFESVSLTDEDRARAEIYATNARREALRTSSRDLTGYLQSLDMALSVGPVTAVSRVRATQLINKTNQFNLTTVRVTETDVERMTQDPSVALIQARLTDRFGDNGLISVLIVRTADETWTVDNWVMSCRVFGRGVENAMFDVLLSKARAAGAVAIVGEYRPSARNGVVASLFEGLGFDCLERSEEGRSRWSYPVARSFAAPYHMRVAATDAPDQAAVDG